MAVESEKAGVDQDASDLLMDSSICVRWASKHYVRLTSPNPADTILELKYYEFR